VQITNAVHFGQQAKKLRLLAHGQFNQNEALRVRHARRDFMQQRQAFAGESANPSLALRLELHQAVSLQTLNDIAGVRARATSSSQEGHGRAQGQCAAGFGRLVS